MNRDASDREELGQMILYYNGTVGVGEGSFISTTYYDHVVLKEHI